ncbi:DUF2207 family protein [Cryobacterium arcticum]|uniref:DUF2207 family protein n=1 Tax=Cryobacterium arcticum TaxID=670052 RepID=UPI0015E831AE|nr:DUF2207 domain-containing protein [Cryobacterium arcticum]
MTRLLKILSSLVVAASVALGAPLAASAAAPQPVANVALAGVATDTSDFTFDSFAADYYLGRDEAGHSTLQTVETFVAEFPDFDQNRGIIRAIPNDYDGVPLHTAVQSVTDARGEPVYFDSTVNGGFTELALGTDEFVQGTQTYVITYTQQNVVRAFTDTNDDEFYWDTNGTGFDQPFGSVTARVHVDPAIAEFLTGNNACYLGAQGASGDCAVSQAADAAAAAPADPAAPSGQVFTAEGTDVGPGENLTVAIGFTAGTFVQVPAETQPQGPSNGSGGFQPGIYQPGSNTPIDFSIIPIGLLGLALLGGAFALAQVFLRPRDAKGRGTIIPQYTVPTGYNLLEAADLIGRTTAAMAAQIVSFAVRGKVRILDYPVSADGGDYTLQLLTAEGVDDQERALLWVFFPGLEAGAVCELGVTNDALADQLANATADARQRSIGRGWRARPVRTPAKTRLLIGFAALAVAALAVLVVGVGLGWLPGGVIFALVLLIGLGVIGASVVASRPLVLTEAGVEQRDYLTGMKVYLDLAEADRFRMLQSPDGALRVTVPRSVPGAAGPGAEAGAAATGIDTVELVKLYEKLLPFAVLWGVEREWAAELAVYYEQSTAAPDWFLSQNAFSGLYLASALNNLVNSVHTTQTPTPPPPSTWSNSGGGSFSGGSFGGGFSGGGGGGGGGGGR